MKMPFDDEIIKTFPKGPDNLTPQYSEWFCKFMNVINPNLGNYCDCQWVSPYGFVPECDCPLHDAPTNEALASIHQTNDAIDKTDTAFLGCRRASLGL